MRTSKPVFYSGLSESIPTVRADENGRFTMDYLRRGKTQLTAFDGIGNSVTEELMVDPTQSVLLQLPEERHRRDVAVTARVRPGQAAPEWQVGPWSDGRTKKLADDRGKTVVLYFWGTDFKQSVQALPAIGKLADRFEPRGVAFRAIHRPDGNEKRTVEEARSVLALKKAPLTFALDEMRIKGHSRGFTAQQYGVINYPVVILIDRAGQIAFRSDMAADDRNVAAVFMQILTGPQAMTEEKGNQQVERAIAEEIESVLK